MAFDPLVLFGYLPHAMVPPLLLLLFSLAARLVVHEEPLIDFIHAIPPRLALAAVGIATAAVLSTTSYVMTATDPGVRQLVTVGVPIMFLACYVLVEGIYAKVKSGKMRPLGTALGGGLAFAATMLAAHYARVPETTQLIVPPQ